MNRLTPYTAVVSARYRNLLQYRAAAFAGFVTQLFWGAVRLMIFGAFYAAAEGPQPMNMVEVVAYVWLGQAMLGMLPWNTDADFKEQVASGAVAYDLLRPLDLYGYWFARTLAFRTAATTLRAIPMVIFAMLLLPAFGLADWALPAPSGAALIGFLAAITAAALLSTAITVVAHISMLWTLSGEGVDRIMPSFVSDDPVGDGRAAAAVSRLAAAVPRVAAVPRAVRCAVSHLQRQHSGRRGRERNRVHAGLDGRDRVVRAFPALARRPSPRRPGRLTA